MDMCRMMSYVEHEKWVSHLFSQLNHVPPPGYACVTMEQILSADRELWTLISEKCRSGLKVNPAGEFPVEVELKMLMFAPSVTYAILPLPKSTQVKRERDGKGDGNKGAAKKQKGDGKGKNAKQKGKGDGKNKRADDSKPHEAWNTIPELKGMWSKVRGNVVCPKFALGECPEDVKPGAFCSRGQHICPFPKCFQKHVMKEHHKQ